MQLVNIDSVIFDIKTILSNNPAPVKRVGVFGSLVTGKMCESSDIDIAIEYDSGESYEKYSFDSVAKFCEFCEVLAEKMAVIYERKIDVIHVEEREGCLLNDIREEVVWI